MDIAAWLRGLGLEEYEPAFRDNRVDAAILPMLTAEDLRDIGIAAVGDRRKLLEAIGALREGTAQLPAQEQPPEAPGSTQVSEAERRQLTVMFCDLVGSTALSARLDPEDLREIIGAYHRCVAKVIGRGGGFVAKYMGDGVLAYFGYPHADEHDAERAVRAALKLVEKVGGLDTVTAVPLQVRVGIATGLVVVGDLVGSGDAQERGVVGETPNLAARLQALAEPGGVVIAPRTRRLTGGLFDYEDLSPVELKGFGAPIMASRVLRDSAAESRFEALRGTATPLVGRDEELALLQRRWQQAKAGEGRVVVLIGEPGIGKSRLAQAMLQQPAGEPHTRLRYFCSPHDQASALHPFITQLEDAAGFSRDDVPEARLAKLEALLALSGARAEEIGFIAERMSVPTGDKYPLPDLTPQRRKEKTLDALLAQMARLAARQPVLMLFEDAHWIDPTSLELLTVTVARASQLPLLLLITGRPEFTPPWPAEAHVTMQVLARFGRREGATLVERSAGGKALPAEILEQILARTDGVPLFLEELTKTIIESGLLREEDGHYALDGALPPLAIPTTLHDSLMARLDRLAPVREVAQIGAAIGREFSYRLLSAVAQQPDDRLTEALDRLVRSELVFRRGEVPDAVYTFKHALVQEAAYGTLLREPRRALHARIAEALESQSPGIAESRPELLAHHCTEAGQTEKAASLWGKAGQRSLERSALVEAAEQLRRALDQIATLPRSPALRREEIKLQVALITPLLHVKGFAAHETTAAAERARLLIEQAEALGEPPEDPLLLFSVLYGIWAASIIAFNGDTVLGLAGQFLALAEKQRATVPLMMGHRIMGASSLIAGNMVEARAHYDQAIALYDRAEHRPLATRFGQDVRVTVLSFRSLNLWVLGYLEATLADVDHAVEDAREIGHAATLMLALTLTSLTLICCGNYPGASAQIHEVVALAGERDASYWKAYGMIHQGCLLALTGNPSNAIQMIASGIIAYRSIGSTMIVPLYLSYLSRAHAEVRQFDDAWRCVDEAMTMVETTKERWCEAEVHRIAGEIALMSPEQDAAKAGVHFERALAVARAQQAKSWELRAAMSMARLWGDQGKRQKAYDLLAPIYGWFTEGFDTADLKDAKALLDQLA